MLRVGAVVAARMGSTRLPGKVVARVSDRHTVLSLLTHRLRRAATLDYLAVATPPGDEEEPIRVGAEAVVRAPRCAPEDVLGRVYAVAEDEGLDYVVRVTADCPLVCPEVVDAAVRLAVSCGRDYVQTAETYPEGLDVEVLSARALWLAHHEATLPWDREHATSWVRRHDHTVPGVLLKTPYGDHGACRLAVDYPEDLEVVREVVRRLGPDCTLRDIVALYDVCPEVWAPNSHIRRNEWKDEAPDGLRVD